MMPRLFFLVFLSLFSFLPFSAIAGETYKLRLYFGLSLPSGGAVSLQQWQAFRDQQLAKAFEGFNVVDSVGFYEGKPERSKIVTLIVDESEIPKAKRLAERYAAQFHQDSVMLVKLPVLEWDFIKAQ